MWQAWKVPEASPRECWRLSSAELQVAVRHLIGSWLNFVNRVVCQP
jgi:hypothetical protein